MHFPESFFHEKVDLPILKNFIARDGDTLSYRVYEGVANDRAVICLHGSGYHGEYLHDLAVFLSQEIGTVLVPNLRGHYRSGKKRGDCAYIGQLEDDIIDLIKELQLQDKKIFLVGHSSGGGLAIRLGGSQYCDQFSGYILLTPVIPTANTCKKNGGWANVSLMKLITLSILNGFGFTNLNHATVITFNMPNQYRDGTETLSYSFNLNSSYHPRYDFAKDIGALGDRYLCIAGEDDELMAVSEFKKIFYNNKVKIIPRENHLGIVNNQEAWDIITAFSESS